MSPPPPTDDSCRWCGRAGWHERVCPAYQRSDGFEQTSAFFLEAYDLPAPPEPGPMEMVSSSHQQLEDLNHTLNEADALLGYGDVEGASSLIQAARTDIYNMLR